MAHTDPAATTLFWSATTGLAILIVLLPFSYVTPTMGQVGFCIILGIVSSVGQYLMVLAYRHAAASVLAPFSYSQLLWATTFGYFIFAAFPDRWTLAGAVLIVAAGIYSARAERRAMAARVLLRR
jgi:drug/metabolite transporter (DMT)-like permease